MVAAAAILSARFPSRRRKGQWYDFEREIENALKLTRFMKTHEMTDSRLKILSGLIVLFIGWLCWSGGTPMSAQSAAATQSPQLQEVVKLTQAKMSDDVILQYIKNSGASYSLSADDILYLNSQGVSQPVISALLASKASGAPAPAAAAPVSTPATPAPPISQPTVSAYPGQQAAPQVSPYPGAPAPVVSPYPGAAPVSPEPVSPPPGSDINLAYFQGQLAPYGQWVDIPGQGLCWVPSVQASVPDWRPYLNDGRWLYTDDGWSWQSDYPWGEYAFHYGRWFRDPRLGWAWVPGYNWGPGWVSWRNAEADGFCGWAPLPPGAIFEPGVGIMWNGRLAVDVDFGLAPDLYCFIPFDHFWAHDYLAFRAPFGRVDFLFRASILANHFSFVGGRFFVGGIGRDRMAILTHRDIRVERLEIRDAHIARARDFEHASFHGGVDHGRVGEHDDRGGHDAGRGGFGGFRDHDGH